MKILYSIQATGNGHIARAIELMPHLQQYGEVDVFLSGANSNLPINLPVKYTSKGLSLFYGNRGGLDYVKMWKHLNLKNILAEAKQLPVNKYDVVINDFESITSLACMLKGAASINFGHQASFKSKLTPRPAKKDFIGECVLQNYATAKAYVGLHFQPYDSFIYNPIIKQAVVDAEPKNEHHITVYLSHYADEVVVNALCNLSEIKFEIFSKKVTTDTQIKNITLKPINNEAFTKSMINSAAVITGAGFETPAEALYLGKKLLCLPINGQYEQWCNAAALEKLGVPIIKKITNKFGTEVKQWLATTTPTPLKLTHSTAEIVQIVMEKARALQQANNWIAGINLHDEDLLSLHF